MGEKNMEIYASVLDLREVGSLSFTDWNSQVGKIRG
jgi:hypothetical protein